MVATSGIGSPTPPRCRANTAAWVPPEPGHPTLARLPAEALDTDATGPVETDGPMSTSAPVSRRSFMRRMVGAGVGLLSLEFVGGSLAFLWPNITEGLGAKFRVGTTADILRAQPTFAQGYPYNFSPA